MSFGTWIARAKFPLIDLCLILFSVQISPTGLKALGAGAVPVLAMALLLGSSSIPTKQVTTLMKARSQAHTIMVFQPERANGVKKYPDHSCVSGHLVIQSQYRFFNFIFFMVGLTIKRLHCTLVFPVCCIV